MYLIATDIEAKVNGRASYNILNAALSTYSHSVSSIMVICNIELYKLSAINNV